MPFFGETASVLLANLLTLSFVWGCVQFHRYDYKAPWIAYAAFLFPVFFLVAGFVATEGLPPQFDALALQ